MPLYVLALTDSPVDTEGIGEGPLEDIDLRGIHAICERRNTAPPLTDEVLRRQHANVIAISSRVRALLPVRYGALLKKDELLQLVCNSAVDIRRGLDDVRDRLQMTIRVLGSTPVRAETPPASGRDYLERRRREASPLLPQRAQALIDAVRPLVVRHRQECGAPGLIVTVYHLVDSQLIPEYERTAHELKGADVMVTGPWPPFAFTPQLF